MTRYLITGGAGFIGSHLVEALLQQGDDVVVLDDFSTGKRENLRPFLDRIRLVEASIVDLASCRQAMAGVDFVLHQAALGSVPRSVADPIPTHDANLTGTLNVLVAARELGVKRVVYAASSSAYGDTEELPKHEKMSARPLSPYAVSKLGGEAYCEAFRASYGFSAVALRYFNVFGPRQDPTSRYAAVIPLFMSAAMANTSPIIFGDGEQSRDFTYVGNIVRANLLACQAPASVSGRVYNVGCGQRITINMLWSEIAGLTGATVKPTYAEGRRGDVRHSLASTERATRELGYQPIMELKKGLEATLEWFRQDNAERGAVTPAPKPRRD
jgi:nucleoside-diphosphate-sugar epimerase